METLHPDNTRLSRNQGSYRTYEEWKHMLNTDIRIHVLGSYRTYEEWKPT